MGKNTIVEAKELQFHLGNAVISYSRPVFPQQLTGIAWKSSSKPVCVLQYLEKDTRVLGPYIKPRDLGLGKLAYNPWLIHCLFFVQPTNWNGIYIF